MQGPSSASGEPFAYTPPGSAPRGVVSLILGCMFSGKTTELLRRVAAVPAPQVFAVKHAIDMRFAGGAIVSHAGKAFPAVTVASAAEIVGLVGPQTALAAVDEAHFFDEGLVDVVRRLQARGLDVVIASLEPDSWARSFPINKSLRALADECIVKHATCARCGAVADRTQRLTPIIGGQMVVDPSNYEPRCQKCWQPPRESDE
jgi:thymidine kinase